MDLFEAMEKRCSVRKFEPVEIPEAAVERILEAGRRAPSGKNLQPVEFVVIRDRRTIAALASVQSPFETASAVIAIVADPAVSKFWLEDASAAAENMLLAITALGYASVWIEGTLLAAGEMPRKLLGVPEAKRLQIALPIGRASGEVARKPRKPLSETVWREKYGAR